MQKVQVVRAVQVVQAVGLVQGGAGGFVLARLDREPVKAFSFLLFTPPVDNLELGAGEMVPPVP